MREWDEMREDFYKRWLLISAGIGAATWIYLAFRTPPGCFIDLFEKLFLFAPLVVVPLVLALVRTPDRRGVESKSYRLSCLAQPICAAGLVGSYFFPPGAEAALLASGWLALTLVIALFGLTRFVSRPSLCIEEVGIDAGLIYVGIGGLWILGSRLGVRPLEFNEIIVLLTAIHFHYAGLSALIIAGLTGRFLVGKVPSTRWTVYRLAIGGMILGITLLAAGITFSPTIEIGAAFLLAASLLMISFFIVTVIVPQASRRLAQILFLLSAGSVVLSMILACLYAYEEFTQKLIMGIPYMARTHGIANAFGFVLCGLLGFLLLEPPSRAPRLGIPFSRLKSRRYIGPDYFSRMQPASASGNEPCGLVDNLDTFQRSDFDPSQVSPEIRSFYEQTDKYDLVVQPRWTTGFQWSGRIYRRLARRMGQMCLPVSRLGSELVKSQILPIDNRWDGRNNVRAWVRTYAASGEPVYVAAYSTHSEGSQTYMNIAFPLPWGNITSILRLDPIPTGRPGDDGLVLTTLSHRASMGDQGVYFMNQLLPIRLPINETIRVWPATAADSPIDRDKEPQATVVARHEMWIFGIKFLTLDYLLFPSKFIFVPRQFQPIPPSPP